jgi:hypothetical protein
VKTLAEVTGSRDYLVSLAKLLPEGVTIVDVEGMVVKDFGDPCFQLVHIVLSDGKRIDVEGEHDLPYLCEPECISPSQLVALYEEGR